MLEGEEFVFCISEGVQEKKVYSPVGALGNMVTGRAAFEPRLLPGDYPLFQLLDDVVSYKVINVFGDTWFHSIRFCEGMFPSYRMRVERGSVGVRKCLIWHITISIITLLQND